MVCRERLHRKKMNHRMRQGRREEEEKEEEGGERKRMRMGKPQ